MDITSTEGMNSLFYFIFKAKEFFWILLNIHHLLIENV